MKPPFKIETHAQLVGALSVAARVEHAVLVEYLFAAFSCRRTAAVASPAGMVSLEAARSLYRIAHDEMRHLATVQNLLAALGAPPVPDIFSLPSTAEAEAPVAVQLTALTPSTLQRFIATEAPPLPQIAAAGIQPPPRYKADFLGDLYRGIIDGISLLGDAAFIGTGVTGDRPLEWARGFTPPSPLAPADAAVAALTLVIEDGEGLSSPGAPAAAGSHWAQFKSLAASLDRLGHDARLVAWDCLDNPGTRAAPGRQLITHPNSLQMAVLGNHAYRLLWSSLCAAYSFPLSAGDPDSVGEARTKTLGRFQEAARGIMATLIRPLGEELARSPAFDHASDARTAGFCFEQYEPVRAFTQPDAAREAFMQETADIHRLFGEFVGDNPRVARVAESLHWIRERFADRHDRPSTSWFDVAQAGRWSTISFSGWYSLRLATGGDPYDDTRGASGWQFAYDGEPDLDRVLRLQPDDAGYFMRPHVHPKVVVGVKVDAAEIGGTAAPQLVGKAVRFVGSPVYDGRNGVLAADGDEPIVPLVVSIGSEGDPVRVRRGHADKYSAPYSELFSLPRNPTSFPAADELRRRHGVYFADAAGQLALLQELIAPLEQARLAAPPDSIERRVLDARVQAFAQPTWPWSAVVCWRLPLRSSQLEFAVPGHSFKGSGTWWLELLSTCYHPDAQAALIGGVLHVPEDDAMTGPPPWRFAIPQTAFAHRPTSNTG